MAERAYVREHRRRKPSGGYTTVRAHERRGVGAGVAAAAAAGALMLGAAPAAVAAGLVVAVPAWAAYRWPNETRAMRAALVRASTASRPMMRAVRRSAVAHTRERLAQRERRHRFERTVGVPLKRLAQHPELLALAQEALAEPDADVFAYVQRAEAAVRRANRRRELRARLRSIRRALRHAEKRLRAETKYAGEFYGRLWSAPAPAWLSASGRGVWSRHSRSPVPPMLRRRKRKHSTLGGLADAAALKALAETAGDRLPRRQRDALAGVRDELWALLDAPAGSSGETAWAPSRQDEQAISSPSRHKEPAIS